MTIQIAKNIDINDICSVCHDEFARHANIVKFPCNHFLHVLCAIRTLALQLKCPLCRAEAAAGPLAEKVEYISLVDGNWEYSPEAAALNNQKITTVFQKIVKAGDVELISYTFTSRIIDGKTGPLIAILLKTIEEQLQGGKPPEEFGWLKNLALDQKFFTERLYLRLAEIEDPATLKQLVRIVEDNIPFDEKGWEVLFGSLVKKEKRKAVEALLASPKVSTKIIVNHFRQLFVDVAANQELLELFIKSERCGGNLLVCAMLNCSRENGAQVQWITEHLSKSKTPIEIVQCALNTLHEKNEMEKFKNVLLIGLQISKGDPQPLLRPVTAQAAKKKDETEIARLLQWLEACQPTVGLKGRLQICFAMHKQGDDEQLQKWGNHPGLVEMQIATREGSLLEQSFKQRMEEIQSRAYTSSK